MFARELKLGATGLLLVLTNRSFSVQDAKSYEVYQITKPYIKANASRKAINSIIGEEINYLRKQPSNDL